MKGNESKFLKINTKNTLYEYNGCFEEKSKIKDKYLQPLSPEMIKFLTHFFIDPNTDLLITNKFLANKILQKLNRTVGEIPIKNIMESIETRKYNLEFYFFETYLIDIGKVLIKNFFAIDKEFKIVCYKDFIEKLLNFGKDIYCKKKKKKKFKASKKEIIVFPNELRLLYETFQLIKTLKFFIPNKVYNIYNYLIVLLNSKWLFVNTLEIELDLESQLFNQVFTDDNADKSLKNIISNSKAYLLMIFYCYFVSTFENLNRIKLKMYDSFQIEIDCILKHRKILINEFHLLDFFLKLEKIQNLELAFNCLDSNTFERFIIILKQNKSIKCIKIEFFSRDDNFYTISCLTKISSILRISLTHLENSGRKSMCTTDNVFDEVEYIVNKLIKFFVRNIQNLFIVLNNKKLTEIMMRFDPPNLLNLNEKYINIMHKFFLNLFYSLETCEWQSFKLKTPHLFFDSTRNPGLIPAIEKIELKGNKNLKNLNISARFIKINNIYKLIPNNLTYLKIGVLDDASLDSLFRKLSNKECNNLSSLKITISKYFFDFDGRLETIYNFFRIKKHYNLQQIYFKSNLILTNEQLNNIYMIIDHDSISKYIFQFNGKYINPDKFNNRKLYTDETDFKFIYNLLYAIEKNKFLKLKNTIIFIKLSQFTKKQRDKIIELKLI